MKRDNLDQLANLIRRERNALLSRWRQQVKELPSAAQLDRPTLDDHIPDLLEELSVALAARAEQSIPEALLEGTPPAHGVQRVEDGFDIEEVVAEYSILRACIHDLADEHGFNLQGTPFHILNRVFDSAVGVAVQAFATRRALEVQKRREEYLGFVAHDLRTPLSAISLTTRILESTAAADGSPPANSQVLKTLRRNVAHLEALVAKVLEENTNLQTEVGVKVERRSFDLWPLVEALIHDLHPIAGTGSTRLVNQVPDDLVVHADAGLLRRVFQNLIANAINYTPHGEVIIGARGPDADGTIECWVRDNGAGIPHDLIDHVFDSMETDPEKSGGMGLGLAIVKTFIEAHDGKVDVDSREGVGSTFHITLPAQPRAS